MEENKVIDKEVNLEKLTALKIKMRHATECSCEAFVHYHIGDINIARINSDKSKELFEELQKDIDLLIESCK